MSDSPPASASPFLLEHLEDLRDAQKLAPVIDLACGRGRNTLALAEAGIPCIGFDRNSDHLRDLSQRAALAGLPVQGLRTNLESPMGIPVRPQSCGAILVFRFLYRPLASAIMKTLCPGGILLYETFLEAHRETGRGPKSPAFYLGSGELLALFRELEIVRYEEGPKAETRTDITARLVARKPRA